MIKNFLLIMLSSIVISCAKKSDSPSPAQKEVLHLVAVTDTFEITSDSAVFNVLANDTNASKAKFQYYYRSGGGGELKLNNDSSFTYKRVKGYIGWDYIDYTLGVNDDGTGSSKQSMGTAYLKVGTLAQWKTKTTLENKKYGDAVIFATDGDTSMYHAKNLPRCFIYPNSNTFQFSIPSPTPGKEGEKYVFFNDQYKILDSGLIVITGSSPDLSPIEIVGGFKAQSIDTLGNTVDVEGYTLYYEGTKYDYIYDFWDLKYWKDANDRSRQK